MADYLYIHVPFCARKCFYCDFASFPFEEQEARSYTDALCRELAIKKNQAGELKTVYIGGGTPSLMPDRFFRDLFSCLRDNFSLSAAPEITVEANPGTLTEAKLGLLLRGGVNRLSIGIQSFQDTELKALGRIHNAKEAAAAVEAAQKTGFTNISLDLMYGIPGQTIASWQETLKRAENLRPAHISAYELTPEKGTPLFGLLEEEKIRLPEEGVVLGMYDCVIDYLSAHGYAQ
ncbi:MAG: radical SAM family heme chaperone HemW, partial [Nitrospiraceae bacterium]|nr:radical SAM family heme chaperone HemW [Nitrospiraceae bacterium]